MKAGRGYGFWLLLLLVFVSVQAWKDRALVEGAPPPLPMSSLTGAQFAWQEVAGRPAVLYFWATWCPICKAMRSNIEALAPEHPVITVALQSGPEPELRRYVREESFTLPVYPDTDGALAARYGLKGVPAVFIVDGQGRIRHAMTGYTTTFGLRFRLWLAAHGI